MNQLTTPPSEKKLPASAKPLSPSDTALEGRYHIVPHRKKFSLKWGLILLGVLALGLGAQVYQMRQELAELNRHADQNLAHMTEISQRADQNLAHLTEMDRALNARLEAATQLATSAATLPQQAPQQATAGVVTPPAAIPSPSASASQAQPVPSADVGDGLNHAWQDLQNFRQKNMTHTESCLAEVKLIKEVSGTGKVEQHTVALLLQHWTTVPPVAQHAIDAYLGVLYHKKEKARPPQTGELHRQSPALLEEASTLINPFLCALPPIQKKADTARAAHDAMETSLKKLTVPEAVPLSAEWTMARQRLAAEAAKP